ncbi:MAG: MMPL family transporter [Bacteroidales bacterium]|jgi:predicted RND superfamily exporter protein|nr:MMPL family transporter [Bacteroidales bacterium]
MGYFALRTTISSEMMQMLPKSDPTLQEYEKFKAQFGQDGAILFVSFQDASLFTVDHFNAFCDLTNDYMAFPGIAGCMSISKLFTLERDDVERKFTINPIFRGQIISQEILDSLRIEAERIPLYDGLLYNKETNVYMIMITLGKETSDNAIRLPLISRIKTRGDIFGEKTGVKVHYSGMPYIRAETTKIVKNEMIVFLIMAFVVAILFLYFFFRSFSATFYPILIVALSTIWTYGIVGLLGYELTILTALVPTVVVIMGVENCIFLLNKYHAEYATHYNKTKALARVIHHIGSANFLTNITTAVGFASFTITGNTQLVQFGSVAALGIMANYLLTLILLPTVYSYLKPLSAKHTKHLSGKFINKILLKVIYIVENKRVFVYSAMGVLLIFSVMGISRLQVTGNMVDEIPHDHVLYQDLLFMEKNFKGVLPLELTIDTKTKRGVLNRRTLLKVDSLQVILNAYPEFSKSLSLADAIKYVKQAYYGGDPEFYEIPTTNELTFIMRYLLDLGGKHDNPANKLLYNFVDSSMQIMRISVQMENIGTKDIARIREQLMQQCDELFPGDKYDISITGSTLVFLEGTTYLSENLLYSLLLAVIVIASLMAMLFSSFRMIVISMIPNLVPLIFTAGIMGYFGIPIKPSTILIFGASLGISVNDSIHYLSRYRLQLRTNNYEIHTSVIKAMKDAGRSMIYSVVVLFFGFAVFSLSSFGGVQVLGILIPTTLLMALFCNLFFLPSLLLSGKKRVTHTSFIDPRYHIIEDAEDDNGMIDEEIKDIDLDKDE